MCEVGVKKEIGQRFRVFRRAIGKKQIQLAREIGVSPSAISFNEKGTSFPKINYIDFLHRNYRLNIDWLLGGKVPMFSLVKGEGKKCDSFLSCHVAYHDPLYGMYFELMELMQVSVVEREILEKVLQIKSTFKNKLKTKREKNGV